MPVLLVCGHFAHAQWRSGATVLALGLGAFALLGLLLVAEYVFARHTVFDEGMHCSGLLTCRRTLRWHDIVQVRYSPRAKWFRLLTRNGEGVRIAAELRGLPPFAEMLLARVEPQAFDEPTRALLEETAAGRLPRVWD